MICKIWGESELFVEGGIVRPRFFVDVVCFLSIDECKGNEELCCKIVIVKELKAKKSDFVSLD